MDSVIVEDTEENWIRSGASAIGGRTGWHHHRKWWRRLVDFGGKNRMGVVIGEDTKKYFFWHGWGFTGIIEENRTWTAEEKKRIQRRTWGRSGFLKKEDNGRHRKGWFLLLKKRRGFWRRHRRKKRIGWHHLRRCVIGQRRRQNCGLRLKKEVEFGVFFQDGEENIKEDRTATLSRIGNGTTEKKYHRRRWRRRNRSGSKGDVARRMKNGTAEKTQRRRWARGSDGIVFAYGDKKMKRMERGHRRRQRIGPRRRGIIVEYGEETWEASSQKRWKTEEDGTATS